MSLAKADITTKNRLNSDLDLTDIPPPQKLNITEQQQKDITPSTTDLSDLPSEQSSPLAPNEVNPLSTKVIINGIETTHQSDFGIGANLTLSNSQSTDIGLNAIKLFSPRIEEKFSNQGIYRTEYNNNYLQAGAISQQRDVSFSAISDLQSELREDSSISPFLAIGRVRQVLMSNGTQSGISRTIRGFNYFLNNQNAILNSSLQLLTEILPNAEPTLQATRTEQPFFVNSNLIQAANNLRLPDNSFTSYSAGWGYATNPNNLQATSPAANYNSIWFGLSSIVSSQVDSSRPNILFTDTTNYYPHVSFSGNTTTVDSVFRYYTGVIFKFSPTSDRSQDSTILSIQDFSGIKAYGGIDFNSTINNGFSYGAGIIGYTNPDPNNYSRISANVNQQIPLGHNSAYSLSLASGLNYAIDGVRNFSDLTFRPDRSFINAGATFKIGDLSLGTTYYMQNGLPNSIGNLLATNISWQAQKNFSISGYYTPLNDNNPRSLYGASASLLLGTEPSSPILRLNWNRNENSLFDNRNVGSDVFGFSLTFGNTFKPTQLGRLQLGDGEK
jgi:hypothetical protein